MKFLGVNFADKLAKSHRSVLSDVTLSKLAPGAVGANPTAGRAIVKTDYAAKGYVGDYTERQRKGTLVEEGDRRVVLFIGTLQAGIVPTSSDRITRGSEVYVLISVKRDPSGTRYLCHARPIGGA